MEFLKQFFKSSNFPNFWKDYQALFKSEKKSGNYVVFDCETTGLNPKKDRILSIGAVPIKDQRIKIKESLEIYVEQTYFDPKSASIHGITQENDLLKQTEQEAVKSFLNLIKNHTLVGHHVNFDVAMINQALKRMNLPKLKNKTLDTNELYLKKRGIPLEQRYSLDELCEAFHIPKKDRHTATGDAFLTAQIMLKLYQE
ncbi:MAG: 3'-5' exonuclease [Flavobacteriaceae bacterium]|nr:3'-5' exonuclease [Flavobacteriaceae bacterium]